MCVRVCARRRAHDHDPIFSIQSFQSCRNLRFICPSIIDSVEGRLLPNGADAMTPSLQQRLDQLAHEIGRLRPDWRRPERFFEQRDNLRREARSIAADAGEQQ